MFWTKTKRVTSLSLKAHHRLHMPTVDSFTRTAEIRQDIEATIGNIRKFLAYISDNRSNAPNQS